MAKTENTESLPTLEVPELPDSRPCLLFTPDEVQRMKVNRDKYVWARHAYLDALRIAQRINRPVRAGDDDDWIVNPAPFGSRKRDHLYSSFCSTLVGYIDDDEGYLRRAFETMQYALDEAMQRWWQPASFEITLAIDGFWPVLSEEEKKHMTGLMKRALEISLESTKDSNQGAGYRKAVVGLGILLKDRKAIHQALNAPEIGSAAIAARCIKDDGFWHETSPGYHHYGMKQLVETAYLCEKIGIDLKNILDRRILSGCRASFKLLNAHLGYPGTGDTHNDRLGSDSLFETAVALYDDPWCGWALRRGSRSSYISLAIGKAKPPHESTPAGGRLLPDSGFAALRTGDYRNFWDSGGLTAYLRFGPHGGWHGHRDSLQMELRAFGNEMVTDSRRAARYRDYEHYGWHRTTLAHSTVVVDKTDQMPSPEPGGQCLHFYSSERAGAACVENPHVYVDMPVYRRSCLLTRRYLVDCFEVASHYDRTCHYVLHGEGTYQSPAAAACVDSLGTGCGFDYLARIRGGYISRPWEATLLQGSWDSHRWKPGGGHSGGGAATGMRVMSAEPVSGRLLLAQALHGANHNFEDCLIVEAYGRQLRFLNLLEPFSGAPSVRSVRSLPCRGLFLLRVEHDSGSDLVFYAPKECGAFEFESLSFKGRFLFAAMDQTGNLSEAVASGAVHLSHKGGNIHESSEESDLDWTDAG